MGYVYMFDIHSNLTIYLEKAEIGIPPSKGKRGRKPTKEKPLSESIRADKYMTGLSDDAWHRIEVRNTAKGKLTGNYHFHRVYIWDEENNRMLSRLLIIRRTTTANGEYEYKYSFSNANLE